MKLELENNKEKLIKYILITVSVAYIVFLLALTLLNRTVGEVYQYKTELFWSYKEYWAERNATLGQQMIANVIVFIPWGLLVPTVFSRTRFVGTVGGALAFSVFTELMQLLLKCGLAEFDDVFHNTLGALIGFGIYIWLQKMNIFKVRKEG